MGIIQDSEYVVYKAIANKVKSGLAKPLVRISLKAMEEFAKFDKINELFLNCDTYEDLGENSKKIRVQKEKLLKLLAIQKKLEDMIARNEQRIKFISEKLGQMGIYNESVDKKQLNNMISSRVKSVTELDLNLNPQHSQNVTLKYFSGEVLAFPEDMLDFSLEENKDILLNGSSDFFHEIIFTFPYSVASIPDEYFMLPAVKNKVLKECVLFVASKIKNQSFSDSDKELGGLLENSNKILSIEQYADELRNYFNFSAKLCIMTQAPNFIKEADSVLKCNDSSQFLPALKRKKILEIRGEETANFELDDLDNNETGAVEDIEQDKIEDTQNANDVNEESSKEDSEETSNSDSGMSKKDLLDLLLSDEDDLDLSSDDGVDENVSAGSELENTLKELEDLLSEEDDEEGGKNE